MSSRLPISLVIATYNRGAAIEPTLVSVLSQAEGLHEVVVVDDGSTDGTADWVTQRFPQVTVIRKVNGGTSSAGNAGAAMATGDWLMFLDHDDLLLPGAVADLQQLMREFPEAVSVHASHICSRPAVRRARSPTSGYRDVLLEQGYVIMEKGSFSLRQPRGR